MKTMLKRLSAVFLAILLLLTHCAAFAEGAQGETTTEETPVLEELVVANPTVVRGEWFTEMWGNSTTDIDVRILIHGYNLVMWESALGTFKPDPMVVRKVITHDLEDGSRTYTFYLKTDLKYSDGHFSSRCRMSMCLSSMNMACSTARPSRSRRSLLASL